MTDKFHYTNSSFINSEVQLDAEDKNEKSYDDEEKEPGVSPAEEIQTENRPTWGNSIEFLMSCISMNVGLGNIWRFPFIAFENGGGAFIIPYLVALILVGRPMYYLEMCLGQFSKRGNVKMYESLAPILKGLGYGQLIGNCCVASYYCSLIAITFFYLINSFTSTMPWSTCNPAWSNSSWLQGDNVTCVASNSDIIVNGTNDSISSSELWFRIEALNEWTDVSEGIGLPEWRLALCLLLSWAVVFLVCAKGVESSGKASYFLAIFPYVILASLFVRAITLNGSVTGILYFVEPRWKMLLNAKVWYSAVSQCFFSLNTGFGTVTMYASYNHFRHNCYRDAMVVTTMDTFTSFLAGLIIFGILGNLAYKMNVDVSEVVKSGGTGLAFISYPEAIARFDAVPWLFAVLFFFMLFVLGVGSMVAMTGSAFTVILDSFPHLKTWHVSLGTSVAGFIIGLAYITPGGQWVFTMVDFFGGAFIFMVLNIFEIVCVAWWYGLDNFCLDVEFMLKRRPGAYFRICWGLIIPILVIFVFSYFIITFEPLTYEGKEYPRYIIVWGWAILAFAIFQTPLWFVISLSKRQMYLGWKKAFYSLFSHDNWGPKETNIFSDWQMFKKEAKIKRQSFKRSWIKDKLCVLVGR